MPGSFRMRVTYAPLTTLPEIGPAWPVMIEAETEALVQNKIDQICDRVGNGLAMFNGPRLGRDGIYFSTGCYKEMDNAESN